MVENLIPTEKKSPKNMKGEGDFEYDVEDEVETARRTVEFNLDASVQMPRHLAARVLREVECEVEETRAQGTRMSRRVLTSSPRVCTVSFVFRSVAGLCVPLSTRELPEALRERSAFISCARMRRLGMQSAGRTRCLRCAVRGSCRG